MEKEEPKQEEKNIFKVVQVPTQHGIAYQTPEGETVGTEQLLVMIANEVRELRKLMVGGK